MPSYHQQRLHVTTRRQGGGHSTYKRLPDWQVQQLLNFWKTDATITEICRRTKLTTTFLYAFYARRGLAVKRRSQLFKIKRIHKRMKERDMKND